MNKKAWLIIILVLAIVMFAVLILSIFGVRKRVDIAQTEGELLYQIYDEKRVGQTFIAKRDNLNIVVLDLKNSALKNQEPIYFRLIETKTSTNLREIEINGRNIGDPSSVRFQFEPIPDSAGEAYYFYLESPTSTEKDATEIYYSSQDMYSGGMMVVDNQETRGELRFTSFYYPGSKTILMREIINDFASRFFTDKAFVFFYLILLVVVFGLSLVI